MREFPVGVRGHRRFNFDERVRCRFGVIEKRLFVEFLARIVHAEILNYKKISFFFQLFYPNDAVSGVWLKNGRVCPNLNERSLGVRHLEGPLDVLARRIRRHRQIAVLPVVFDHPEEAARARVG